MNLRALDREQFMRLACSIPRVVMATLWVTQAREWQMVVAFGGIMIINMLAHSQYPSMSRDTWMLSAMVAPLGLLGLYIIGVPSPCMTDGYLMGFALTSGYTIIGLLAAFLPTFFVYTAKVWYGASPAYQPEAVDVNEGRAPVFNPQLPVPSFRTVYATEAAR